MKFFGRPNLVLALFLGASWFLLSAGGGSCAEPEKVEMETAADESADFWNVAKDPFGLVSGGADLISQPFRDAGERVAPSAPSRPEAAVSAPLKTRPNLNYTPYSVGYRVDRLTIRPVAEYYRVWDNNLFRAENGRQEDSYHRVLTGFNSSYALDERGTTRARLGYLATLEYFDRHSNQDHDDHAVTAGGTASLGQLKLNADGRWARSSSRGNINLPDPQSTAEVATVRGLAELPMGVYFSEFEVNNFHMDSLVQANSGFDRNELVMAPRLGINLSDVDQLFFEYARTEIRYPNADDRDGSADQESIGLRSFLNEKTSLTGLVGYQSRVYDIDDRPDFFGIVGSVRLQHKFEENHGFAVQFDRKPSETSYDNQSFVVGNGLTYDYRRPVLMKNLHLIKRGGVSYQEYSRNSTTNGDTETRREYVWNDGIGCEYFLPGGFSSFYVYYNYSAIESNTENLAIDDQMLSYGFKGYF